MRALWTLGIFVVGGCGSLLGVDFDDVERSGSRAPLEPTVVPDGSSTDGDARSRDTLTASDSDVPDQRSPDGSANDGAANDASADVATGPGWRCTAAQGGGYDSYDQCNTALGYMQLEDSLGHANYAFGNVDGQPCPTVGVTEQRIGDECKQRGAGDYGLDDILCKCVK
ncbi:MAG TPA: hypothetical protein VM925_12050 [Labilithrix sp.]|jgi:hypothetical protein|nr:hypothetical protein [Labilithrix sp.]